MAQGQAGAQARRRRGNAEKTCFSLRCFSLRLCASAPLRLCVKGFENLLKNCKALSHKGLSHQPSRFRVINHFGNRAIANALNRFVNYINADVAAAVLVAAFAVIEAA